MKSDDRNLIVSWLNQNVSPLGEKAEVETDEGFIQLKAALFGVKVVGVGEASHGTSEFFRMRLRILQFLVKNMGFNVLAIEAGWYTCAGINDYIVHGRGQRDDVIMDLNKLIYDIQEFADVIDWLASYNRPLPEHKRVRFYGFDIWPNHKARYSVLRYLKAYLPDIYDSTKLCFSVLDDQEAMWPAQSLNETEDMRVEAERCHIEIEELLSCLRDSKEYLIQASSQNEYAATVRDVEIIDQWVTSSVSSLLSRNLPQELAPKNLMRSKCMAENFKRLLGQSTGDSKFVVWAHNYHISKGLMRSCGGIYPNFGDSLRGLFHKQYYAIGLDFLQGTYLAREAFPDSGDMGELKVVSVPTSREGTLPALLGKVRPRQFLLNIRSAAAASPEVIKCWLSSVQQAHMLGWLSIDNDAPYSAYFNISLAKNYDGFIFIKQTSHTIANRRMYIKGVF